MIKRIGDNRYVISNFVESFSGGREEFLNNICVLQLIQKISRNVISILFFCCQYFSTEVYVNVHIIVFTSEKLFKQL